MGTGIFSETLLSSLNEFVDRTTKPRRNHGRWTVSLNGKVLHLGASRRNAWPTRSGAEQAVKKHFGEFLDSQLFQLINPGEPSEYRREYRLMTNGRKLSNWNRRIVRQAFMRVFINIFDINDTQSDEATPQR